MKDFKYISAEEAVNTVNSGERVFIHGSAATPLHLLNALLRRAGEVQNVELVSISMFGDVDWKQPGVTDSFKLNSLFVRTSASGQTVLMGVMCRYF